MDKKLLPTDIDLSTADIKHINKDQLVDLVGRLQNTKAEGSAQVQNNEAHNVASSKNEMLEMKIMIEKLSNIVMTNMACVNNLTARMQNAEKNSASPLQSTISGEHTANIPGGESKEFSQEIESNVEFNSTSSISSSVQTPPKLPMRQGVYTDDNNGNINGSTMQMQKEIHHNTSDRGGGLFEQSPNFIDYDFIKNPLLQSSISLEIKESLPASKDFKLQIGKSGIKCDEFHFWFIRITDAIEATTKFRSFTNSNISESYKQFCLTFPKSASEPQLQMLFLTAHCKLWVFLTECLPTSVRTEITHTMKSDPNRTNIPHILGFKITNNIHSTESFYKNCRVLLDILYKRYFSASVHNRGGFMRDLERLKCDDDENPREFFVKWQDLQNKLTLTVKGYVAPPEELQIQQIAERLPRRYNVLRTMANDPANQMTLERLISWAGNTWQNEQAGKSQNPKSQNPKGKPAGKGKTPEETANPAFTGDKKPHNGKKHHQQGKSNHYRKPWQQNPGTKAADKSTRCQQFY